MKEGKRKRMKRYVRGAHASLWFKALGKTQEERGDGYMFRNNRSWLKYW